MDGHSTAPALVHFTADRTAELARQHTDCGFGERKSRVFVSERSTENLKGCVDATMGTLLNYRTRIEDFRKHTT